MIALSLLSGLRNIDKVNSSTASVDSGSRAEVGSRFPRRQHRVRVGV